MRQVLKLVRDNDDLLKTENACLKNTVVYRAVKIKAGS